MACHEFDAQVARPDEKLKALEEKFVRLRVVNMAEVDVARFAMDFNTTFGAFVLNHEGGVYCRYGARTAESAEAFVNLPSFNRALRQGLAMHERWKEGSLELPPPPKPVLAQAYPNIRKIVNKGQCVHCHQVSAAQAEAKIAEPNFNKLTDVWVYPDPVRLGLHFDSEQGNALAEVKAPASEETRMKAGTTVIGIGDRRVTTYADIQYALSDLPKEAKELEVTTQDGVRHSIDLPEHWRVTDISRLPMHHKLKPFPEFWGRPVAVEKRTQMKLEEDGFSTVVTKFWTNTNGKKAGMREGDIVVAVNGVRKSPLAINAMVYTRLHHRTGEEVEFTVLRGGKELKIKCKLRAKPW